MKKLMIAPLLGMIMLTGCGVVENYETAIVTRFGKIVDDDIKPGLCFYNPFTSDLLRFDLRETVVMYKTSVFTSDIQSADVGMSVTYSLNPLYAKKIYSEVGQDYGKKIVDPIAVSTLKDVMGHYEADKMVMSREQITKEIFDNLSLKLTPRGIIASKVNIINIDYSDAFEKSVEEKQVALQASIRAKNETARIEEEARQTLVKAKAEAEAIKIKTEAIEKGRGVIILEAIDKWDGKLPQIITEKALPIIKQ